VIEMRIIQKLLKLLTVALTIIILFVACTNVDTVKTMGTKIEKDFILKDLNGNDFKLSDELGKKVYIKFWATWCPVCLGGIDELTILNNENMDNDKIEIITIVSPGVKGEMSSEKFKAWFEKQGYTFNVLLDEGGNIARDFGIRGYPTSVFIGTNGGISKTQIGHVSNSDINKILGEIL
jgi:thiol-disulfide isomerase/thioredoxin